MSDSKEPQAIPRGPERELKIYALGLSGWRWRAKKACGRYC